MRIFQSRLGHKSLCKLHKLSVLGFSINASDCTYFGCVYAQVHFHVHCESSSILVHTLSKMQEDSIYACKIQRN